MGASKEFPITDHEFVRCGCSDPDCPYCLLCAEQKCFHGVQAAVPVEKFRESGNHAINEHGIYMEDMIAESHIGRSLRAHETVLHRNGDTLDNRWDNLYVAVDGVEIDPGEVR